MRTHSYWPIVTANVIILLIVSCGRSADVAAKCLLLLSAAGPCWLLHPCLLALTAPHSAPSYKVFVHIIYMWWTMSAGARTVVVVAHSPLRLARGTRLLAEAMRTLRHSQPVSTVSSERSMY